MRVSLIFSPTRRHMMNLTVVRQLTQNGCIDVKGERKIAKDEATYEKRTFSCKCFCGEFEKQMLSALLASSP